MTTLLNLFFNVFTTIIEKIGTVAGYSTCSLWYDEPEVPEELTKLYE
ncbi:cyclic lactone autoinducer peptide [Staphylococcus simiae]|nr:cyclic lactone autoinducer peptide [Staphylococcus simiae]MBO1198325.1 cyclic lactone autoinducer peptide [Staphylococcus simiae]MBO1200383.1 cyclic lactone autoinducer peptide [Staphylococcus simiae]MBO1202656.1 cyclic lactone autoinducer peptide [Staphylococcus simiae]MBO1210317.1 cyclic lactone autoinducer peptide [Staphylococcus simiae]MBO1228770.1 cyclic lactone autoinducer peptide [Staphylococcus simiae]